MNIIIGKLNSTNQCFYWNIEKDMEYCLGDYAIVENKSDYDLVKIVGTLETNEKYVNQIVGNKVNKKVIKVISREKVRED